MSDAHPLIGQPKAVLDTPALLVDLDVLDANIKRIADACRAHGVGWRPHMKGHKTPEIARRQLGAGAIGVTCAKVSEAEVMAAAGIRNILIANEVVGAPKVRRLIDLVGSADLIVGVDSFVSATELSDAASAQGKTLKVAIEVNTGMNRAGVEPGAATLALAAEIAGRPGLRLVGLFGWESHAVTLADPAEKERTVREAVGKLTATARACREAGHGIEVVSCGGTGTFPYCIEQAGVTEVQIGGAIFSDRRYREQYHMDFPFALTVLATVISRPSSTRIVLDAGRKTMSGDAAMPQPLGLPAIAAARLSAEHATIELRQSSDTPRIGDKVEFVVGYHDTTVHLHEEIVAVRNGRVEAVWRVAARGKIK
ncbi:MAG: DSD1 family PLP-dependent enzyme [Stellaceae bacterium]